MSSCATKITCEPLTIEALHGGFRSVQHARIVSDVPVESVHQALVDLGRAVVDTMACVPAPMTRERLKLVSTLLPGGDMPTDFPAHLDRVHELADWIVAATGHALDALARAHAVGDDAGIAEGREIFRVGLPLWLAVRRGCGAVAGEPAGDLAAYGTMFVTDAVAEATTRARRAAPEAVRELMWRHWTECGGFGPDAECLAAGGGQYVQ